MDTVTYDTHGRHVIKETDCLGQDRRALSRHNGWGQPTTVKRFLNAKQDNTNAVTTTHTYTPGGWLTVSRESTGAYTGRFRAKCTPASDSYCPTGTAYFIKTRQTTPTPTRREGLMHDSFNPQVGNFQSALLGNFQPVLTSALQRARLCLPLDGRTVHPC